MNGKQSQLFSSVQSPLHFAVYLVVLTLAVLASPAAKAAWQTTWFEVVVAPPNPSGRTAESVVDKVMGLAVNQDEISKMESFLHDVAAEYEKMGFADPVASGHLVPVVEELLGDKKRVRIYLFDIAAWSAAYSAADVEPCLLHGWCL